MSIENYDESWCKFLRSMGPQNISLVKNLTIVYPCSLYTNQFPIDDDDYGYVEECKGFAPQESLREHDRWADMFGYFKEARPTLQLLAIHLQPCAGYNDDPDHWYYGEEEDYDRFRRRMVNSRKHRECRVFRDMNIQKHLLFFSNAREISISGRFNPLISLLLRREHGSIIKRWREPKSNKRDYYRLDNLNPEYRIDLENFTESRKMKGVYYENVAEEPQEEEEEEASSESEPETGGSKQGIHHFFDKEDDELDRWDFPDMPFLREVVPRITQASPVTGNA
ncbi:hypothetical protein F4815DRAFT_449344 [Daldinia loculata]|nr:hypothetical protein F4815DRAFT_449344 [Daldinia loculata]